MAPELDCDTPLGVQAVAEQDAIIAMVAAKFGGRGVPTKPKTCPWDATFEEVATRRALAVAEVKARDMTYRQLTVVWEWGPNPGYLITFDKVLAGQAESTRLGVPYLVFVGLKPEYRLVYWKVTDTTGAFLWRDEIVVANTPTKTSVNDPTLVWRDNAYLPVARMREVTDATWGPVAPPQRRPVVAPRPGISKLCRACGTLLDQMLVVEGADFHVTCRPKRPRLKVVRP